MGNRLGVRPEGLEPSTFGTGIQRSIQLNYGRRCEILVFASNRHLNKYIYANIRCFGSKISKLCF